MHDKSIRLVNQLPKTIRSEIVLQTILGRVNQFQMCMINGSVIYFEGVKLLTDNQNKYFI